MKTALKKMIVAAVAIGFVLGISSCEKHTCPTYSQNTSQQAPAKA